MTVWQLRADLLGRAQELHVEIARLELAKRELGRITAALDLLPEEQIVQLELLRKGREEGGSKEQVVSTVDGDATARKRPTRLTNEAARDWILDEIGDAEWSTAELQVRFGVSRGTAQNRARDLSRMQIIVPGSRAGRWKYNGAIPNGPRVKPRGEHLLEVPARRNGGTAVPGTGVPRGPAGTPGALKRQQNSAARVKMPKRTGVRL